MATEVVRTVGTGGDFATIADAFAALPASLALADQKWTFHLLDEAHVYSGVMQSKQMDATRYAEWTALPGTEWNLPSKPIRKNTGPRVVLDNVWAIVSECRYTRITNLQINRAAAAGYFNLNGLSGAQARDVQFNNCMFVLELATAGAVTPIINLAVGGEHPKLANNIFLSETRRPGSVLYSPAWTTGDISAPIANCLFAVAPYASDAVGTEIKWYDYYGATDGAIQPNYSNSLFMYGNLAASIFFIQDGGYISNASNFRAHSTSAASFGQTNSNVQDAQRNVTESNVFVAWAGADESTLDLRLKQGGKAWLSVGTNTGAFLTNNLDVYGAARSTTQPTRGPIENEYNPALVVSGDPILLSGDLTLTGSITIAAALSLVQQGAISFSGALELLGDIASTSKLTLEQLEPLVLSGKLTITGNVTASIRFTEGLPPDWYVLRVLESVPNPNFGSLPYGQSFFTRWTYLGFDDAGTMLAASGAEEDCFNQLLSIAQTRSQQQPYDGN